MSNNEPDLIEELRANLNSALQLLARCVYLSDEIEGAVLSDALTEKEPINQDDKVSGFMERYAESIEQLSTAPMLNFLKKQIDFERAKLIIERRLESKLIASTERAVMEVLRALRAIDKLRPERD